jgi:hypothetical protein
MTNTEPAVEPTESNPPEHASPKATLGQFIEENSKLITSIAAFVALTAFSSQMDNGEIKLYFSALTFLAAVLLTLELHSKFPIPPHHWRLGAFSHILTILVAAMGWYWFSQFPAVWVPQLFSLIQGVVLLGVAVLLTYSLTAAIKFAITKLFRSKIQDKVMSRISLVVFLCCAVLLVAGLFWVSRKLAAHPITIHIPKVSGESATPNEASGGDEW